MLGLTCRMLGPCWTHVGVSWVDVGPMLTYFGSMLGPCWAYLGLSWLCWRYAVGFMLALCWPILADVGRVLMYVGRMLAACCICVGRWPMLTYVGRTWAYVGDVGPMLALRRPILVDVGSVLTYIC